MISLSLISLPSFASKGDVVMMPDGCDYYIVETRMGYAILEWFGGSTPSVGDTLVGDFESYGTKDIYNLSRRSKTRVWVENYLMSQDDAVEGVYDKCN